MRPLKVLLTAILILVSGLAAISPATAAGETITISTTSYSPSVASNVGIALSGFDQNQSYQATVKFVNTSTNADVTNGTLTATQNGTTLIAGYTSYAAAKLGFKGTYAQIAAALSSITWNASAASGDISIRIGIASAPGLNEFYDANSTHYYKYVSSGLAWVDARAAAENTILFGMRGYLTEINSAAENSFIGTETSATNVWIGASDRATEGTWIWDGATSTYTKPVGSGGSALGAGGAYQSWSSGEPNDHSSGWDGVNNEDCAVTNWQGVVGKWNDLPCGAAYSYLMEFGGRPGQTSTATTSTLTTTVTAIDPRVISVAAIGGVTVPATGGTPVSSVTAANGYTGTVTWSPPGTAFAASTTHTATITLTAASSYTLSGVTANFFTVAGATSVTHNANSGVITAVFPATAIAPPAFTLSSATESLTQGSTLSGYTTTSTGGAIASYAISPAISNTPGLSFSTSTGLISGTPTTPGASRIYTITATNVSGNATQTFAVTVNLAAPSFTLTTNSVSGMQGSPITGYSISSSGGAIDSFSISPAISNTPGLSFSASTGLISGTPTAPSGARSYTITATNAVGSTSRAFELTVNSPPPPSDLKTITSPKIQRDASHYICLAGSFVFIRNGYTEEASKITSQKYFLVQDGKIVDFLESMLPRATFERKSSHLNSTLTCSVEVRQEGIQTTVSSLSSKLIATAMEAKREELIQVDIKYYADRTTAYSNKDKEFARIEEVKRNEIAAAKTSAAILLASAKYQKAFSVASELWKLELRAATSDRDAARITANTNYLELLEKSGVSINPRTPPVVIPTPTPSPTSTSTPTPAPSVTATPIPIATPSPSPSSTNPQPSAQMPLVGTVYMATGTYFLNDATKLALNEIALQINASGAKSILVYGHTDNRGRVNNTVLSQNRAKAVAKFLRPLVNTKKISIGWFASKKPVAGGTSAAALALNRRVEIYTK